MVGGYNREGCLKYIWRSWKSAKERYIIIENYFQYQEDIILVRYEDFLNDKIEVIESLSDNLGIAKICDISTELEKQYQPKGKKQNVDILHFFGEKNRNTITNICRENMRRLGY